MQIGRMRFARVERHDHALVLDIDSHISHSGYPLQRRSQFAHALIAIFPSVAISIVSRTASPLRSPKNGSAGSGSAGRAGSMAFSSFLYLTCETDAAVVS